MGTGFQSLLLFATYLGAGLALLAGFTFLYMRITPYDEAAQIKDGEAAPAIALAGAMLGFTFPLLVASHVRSGFTDFIAWGLIACLVQLVVFWVLYWLLPRVIATNNSAGALCFATASVCAGLLNAVSFMP
jgi:putative membrane protein